MSARDRIVGVVRRVDRKIFRRSVALLDRVGRLRDELARTRSEVEDLRAEVVALTSATEEERRETRAQFLIIRSALEASSAPDGASRS